MAPPATLWQRLRAILPNPSPTLERVKNLELLQWAVLGLSATGVAYAILGLSAAYLALVAAKEANRWAYYMYELALMAVRLQLMQLCAGTVPDAYENACAGVRTWSGWLEYVATFLYPPDPTASNRGPSVSTGGDLKSASFASTSGGIVVITFAALSLVSWVSIAISLLKRKN